MRKMWLFKFFAIIFTQSLLAMDATQPDPTHEPPVPVLEMEPLRANVFSSEEVKLKCKIDDNDWTVTWEKDSQELHSGPDVSFSENNSLLTIKAGTMHAGDYTCSGQHKTTSVLTKKSNTIKVTVNNPPIPTMKLVAGNIDAFATEKLEFSCEVSDPEWTFKWFRNHENLHQDSVLKINEKGTSLTINSVSQTHKGQYSCKAQLTSRGVSSKFSNTVDVTVKDRPMPTVKPSTSWLDVYETERISFSCEVNDPNWTYAWYKDKASLKPSSELVIDEKGGLLFSSISQTHQGQYSCRAEYKSRGITSEFSDHFDVKVYSSQPKPTVTRSPDFNPMYPGEPLKFTCGLTESNGWEYVWYHNGTEISSTNNGVYDIDHVDKSKSGKYYCKAKRGSPPFYTQSSNSMTIHVSDPPKPTVKTTWLDVYKTERMTISCEVSDPQWTYVWFKDKNPIREDTILSINEKRTLLTINSVSQTHQAQYSCKAQLTSRNIISDFSNTADVKVYASQPKPTVSRSSNFNPMYPGEPLKFTCGLTESKGWEYVWYHNGTEISSTNNGAYDIDHVDQSKSGKYYCKAKRGSPPFYTQSSDTMTIHVSDPPKPTVKTMWLDVYKTERMTISCEVSDPQWTYVWFKDKNPILEDTILSINEKGTLLTINSVSQTHQAQYSCKAQLTSRNILSDFSNTADVKVYASHPKPTVSRSSDFNPMYPGEPLKFTCVLTESKGWEYVWYHNGTEISATNNGAHDIDHVDKSKNGEYSCKAKRGSPPFYTQISDNMTIHVSDTPLPVVKNLTRWLDVFKNESVELSCEVSIPDWTFTWFRNKEVLKNDSELHINEKGTWLNITSISEAHQGQYTCKAHLTSRKITSDFSNSADVKVYQHIPKPKLQKNPNFDPMYVGEKLNFNCQVDVSSDWNYQWYKDDKELKDTDMVITIPLEVSDSGEYRCRAWRGSKTITAQSEKILLNVQEIPVPVLKKATQWLDVFPGESMNMRCKIEGNPDWEYTWHKDNNEIKPEKSVSFSKNKDMLFIKKASDSLHGNYSCSGKLKGRSVMSKFCSEVKLKVYDKTPSITLVQNPGDSLMHTEDFVSFSCHINVSSGWNYLWFKNNNKLTSSSASGNNYNISSATKTDTASYECQVKRGDTGSPFISQKSPSVTLNIQERPMASLTLQTGWSEVFSTDSLVLKCKVLDSDLMWNFTWYKEGNKIDLPYSEDYIVTPQNDPGQSHYTCQGIRSERPFYSKRSTDFRTKNLLLKRRILLSISGCLFFGIIAVFLGCIFLRIFRKPVIEDEKPEEINLFIDMKSKDFTDAPCPLVEYITDAAIKGLPGDVLEGATACSETTPLPITPPDELALTVNNHVSTENGHGLSSFQK